MADMQPRGPWAVGDDAEKTVVPGLIRIERYGPKRSRLFIDGELFPWATSPVVTKVITDANGMVDVTLAIRCSSAEIVNLEPIRVES